MFRSLVSRRHFLTLTAASTGSVLLSQCARSRSVREPQSPPATATSTRLAKTDSGNVVETTLTAQPGTLTFNGQTVPVFTYNGQYPAPRLEARPGDRVRIRFTNRLDEPSNLHFHGLHVPPTGNADNVFIKVPAGETQTYEFDIPADHPAGTFYYHPHYHGYVARQVFAGLGGTFVVRGDLDEIPEVRDATEQFVVLKDFAADFATAPMGHMAVMRGREGQFVTVNGRQNPRLTLPEGGLLRLRLLNASNARFYRLALDDRPFYLIATDGGAVSQPVELNELLLSPGERAEVLVKGDRPQSSFRLLDLPYRRGGMGMMGGRMGGRQGMMHGGGTDEARTLATLAYAGREDTPRSLPQQLLPVEPLPEPDRVRQFTLSHGMARGRGMVFLINGKAFDGDRVDVQPQLGQIEDWEITNTGMFDHPFHLHVNPFQVVSRNGQPEPVRAWKDTVNVKVGETVRIRTQFRDFPGKTVYHCHILDHEDRGMMGLVEMV